MGDAHFVVVHHHSHIVGGHAVGAADDHVIQLAHIHGYFALDHVVKKHLARERRSEAHATPFAGPQIARAAMAVVTRLEALAAGLLAHGLHLFGRAGTPVGVPAFQQPVHITVVDIRPLGLVGEVAVPVQTQPAHGGQNGIRVFLPGSQQIRIFNAQVKTAAEMAGQEPAENGRARAADVQMPGGTGRKTGDNFRHSVLSLKRECRAGLRASALFCQDACGPAAREVPVAVPGQGICLMKIRQMPCWPRKRTSALNKRKNHAFFREMTAANRLKIYIFNQEML